MVGFYQVLTFWFDEVFILFYFSEKSFYVHFLRNEKGDLMIEIENICQGSYSTIPMPLGKDPYVSRFII